MLRDITAVTHMSVDREARLRDLEQRWSGPIVAAIYTRSSAGAATIPLCLHSLLPPTHSPAASDDAAAANMTRWLQRARLRRPASGGWCTLVLRAAQPEAYALTHRVAHTSRLPQLYPVNHIRNAAWNASRTQVALARSSSDPAHAAFAPYSSFA